MSLGRELGAPVGVLPSSRMGVGEQQKQRSNSTPMSVEQLLRHRLRPVEARHEAIGPYHCRAVQPATHERLRDRYARMRPLPIPPEAGPRAGLPFLACRNPAQVATWWLHEAQKQQSPAGEAGLSD